jgi:hypothetical protein
MAHSLELDALFGDRSLRVHAPRAETRGLAHADREGVGQESLLLLRRRWRFPVALRALRPWRRGLAECCATWDGTRSGTAVCVRA